jgi:PiT family inorganic phosphate transporter
MCTLKRRKSVITLFTILVGMFMAFTIGANDVANGIATAVGAKAITPKQAAFLASFLEFLSAVMFGATVTKTIANGIVSIEHITIQITLYTVHYQHFYLLLLGS